MPNYTVICDYCEYVTTVFRTLENFGKWPKHCHKRMRQIITPSQVIKDIEPFQSVTVDVATGNCPIITSRAHKQEFMRRNKLIEWGTEKVKEKSWERMDKPGQELKRAVHEVLGRRR